MALRRPIGVNLDEAGKGGLGSGIASILSELNAADAPRGKRIHADDRVGIGRGLDEQGRLPLEDDAGSFHAILSGAVELL